MHVFWFSKIKSTILHQRSKAPSCIKDQKHHPASKIKSTILHQRSKAPSFIACWHSYLVSSVLV